jgi:hypothetical protein
MKKKPSNMHVDQAAMSAISSAMSANNASAIPSAPAMSADRVRTDEAAHDVASPPPSPDASPDAARVRAVAAAVTAMTAAEAAKAAATESAGALQQHAWHTAMTMDKDNATSAHEQIFRSLAAAEMFNPRAAGDRGPMRRAHVAEKMWSAADPVLQRLLAWWESKQCTLNANHAARLACLQRYLAFQVEGDVKSSRLQSESALAANVSDRAKVSAYCEFLEKAGLAAETIKKRLLALRHVVMWYRAMVLRPDGDKAGLDYTRCKQTEEYFTILINGYQTQQHGSTRNDRSIGALVRANLWPADEEVRQIIKLNLADYCTKVSEAKKHKTIGKADYAWCLSFILNAIVIHGNSCRAGYFSQLSVGIAKEAAAGGLCASTNFKTSKSYLVQVIALDAECRKLVDEYLNVLRPLVLQAGGTACDNDLLFINSNGAPVKDVSKVVSILWEQSFSKPMCITVLRYWKATHLALAATTTEERNRILKAEGHSDRVSRRHYEKIWTIADAAQAKRDNDRICKLSGFKRASEQQLAMTASNDEPATTLALRKKRRRQPWSLTDTYTLLDNEPKFSHCPDRWEQCLDCIRPLLQCKERTGTSLKDRFRWAQEKIMQGKLPARPL